jgi:hypothetical protein
MGHSRGVRRALPHGAVAGTQVGCREGPAGWQGGPRSCSCPRRHTHPCTGASAPRTAACAGPHQRAAGAEMGGRVGEGRQLTPLGLVRRAATVGPTSVARLWPQTDSGSREVPPADPGAPPQSPGPLPPRAPAACQRAATQPPQPAPSPPAQQGTAQGGGGAGGGWGKAACVLAGSKGTRWLPRLHTPLLVPARLACSSTRHSSLQGLSAKKLRMKTSASSGQACLPNGQRGADGYKEEFTGCCFLLGGGGGVFFGVWMGRGVHASQCKGPLQQQAPRLLAPQPAAAPACLGPQPQRAPLNSSPLAWGTVITSASTLARKRGTREARERRSTTWLAPNSVWQQGGEEWGWCVCLSVFVCVCAVGRGYKQVVSRRQQSLKQAQDKAVATM